MKGSYTIELISRNLHYRIVLNRNITILRGDSGIGKTTLCEKIRECLRTVGTTKMQLKSTAPVAVLSGVYREDIVVLNTFRDNIFIVDETAKYLNSKEFAEIVMRSPNYFLIISRQPLYMLPYSHKSTYTLVTHYKKEVYLTELKELFSNGTATKIDKIITEDSNSGRQMMKACYGIVEESELSGNSTLLKRAQDCLRSNSILIFADGAALGSYINSLRALTENKKNKVILWAPESFEYLLLTSGIVHRGDVPKILEAPKNQIDSQLFPSWERFFTWLVMDIMSKYPGHEYNKKLLKAWYMSEENIAKFKSAVPKEIAELLK